MVCGSAAGFRNRNRIPFRPTDVCHVQRLCVRVFAGVRYITEEEERRERPRSRSRVGETRGGATRAHAIVIIIIVIINTNPTRHDGMSTEHYAVIDIGFPLGLRID